MNTLNGCCGQTVSRRVRIFKINSWLSMLKLKIFILWYAIPDQYERILPKEHVYTENCFIYFSYLEFHWPFPWASCQIRKIAGAHAPGMPGTFSPPPRVSNPDMHHGTCVTHVPWCMPGSLTRVFLWIRRRGKTFPAFPAHAQPAILRIW